MMAAMVMRLIAIGVDEIKKFIPKLWGIARELFHEIMGFIFLVFALFFTFGSAGLISTYQKMDSDPDSGARLLTVGVFVLMFAAFSFSSFRRAKRISRRR